MRGRCCPTRTCRTHSGSRSPRTPSRGRSRRWVLPFSGEVTVSTAVSVLSDNRIAFAEVRATQGHLPPPGRAVLDRVLAEPVVLRSIPGGLHLRSVAVTTTTLDARFTADKVTFRPPPAQGSVPRGYAAPRRGPGHFCRGDVGVSVSVILAGSDHDGSPAPRRGLERRCRGLGPGPQAAPAAPAAFCAGTRRFHDGRLGGNGNGRVCPEGVFSDSGSERATLRCGRRSRAGDSRGSRSAGPRTR